MSLPRVQVGYEMRIEAADIFYYSDALVTCGQDNERQYYRTRPCLIVEVLSPGTEAIDCRERLLTYRQLDSLRESVPIAQDERRVETYRRSDAGWWCHEIVGPDDELRLKLLTSSPLVMTLDEVYEDVEFNRE